MVEAVIARARLAMKCGADLNEAATCVGMAAADLDLLLWNALGAEKPAPARREWTTTEAWIVEEAGDLPPRLVALRLEERGFLRSPQAVSQHRYKSRKQGAR